MIAPVGDKPREIVRSGALAHLPYALGESLRPGELARELARRAGREEQAVAPRLDQLGRRAMVGCDDREAIGKGVDQRARQRLAVARRQYEVGRALEPRLQ